MTPRPPSLALAARTAPGSLSDRRGTAAGGDDDLRYRALVAHRDMQFRRLVLRRRDFDGHLLSRELPIGEAEAGPGALLPDVGGSTAGRLPGVQALPSGQRLPGRRSGTAAATSSGGRCGPSTRASSIARASPALARRLGYSPRQLQRLLVAEVGAGPLELARAQRAETARVLLETTDLRIAEVVFAAGFGSVRQFNDTLREIFGEPPRAMRERAGRRTGQAACVSSEAGGPRSVTLRLAYRRPFPMGVLFAFLADRAVPGVEEGDRRYYRRALSLPHGAGVATVRDGGDGALRCSLQLEDLREITLAVQRIKHVFDLDADPAAVQEVLGGDRVLGSAVTGLPGLRIPGHVDGGELALRAVLGQQVSVTGARTLAGRLAPPTAACWRSPSAPWSGSSRASR